MNQEKLQAMAITSTIITLAEASDQFIFYSRSHLNKVPPQIGKAKVNTAWAEKCQLAAKKLKDSIRSGQTNGPI